MQDLEERSGGVWRPSPGAIYPALQLLEDQHDRGRDRAVRDVVEDVVAAAADHEDLARATNR